MKMHCRAITAIPAICAFLAFTSVETHGQAVSEPEVQTRATPSVTAPTIRRAAGGVRIRSFRGRTPRVLQDVRGREGTTGISRADLDLLERRILRALDLRFSRLYDEMMFGTDVFSAAGPGSYFVLYSPEGDAAPDTVFLPARDPAEVFEPRTVETPPIPRPIAEARRAALSPLVERIEREMIDAGLFNAVTINFEFDGNAILPGSEPVLDAIGEILVRNPELSLRVEGHTDNVGRREYNQRLSEERARAVIERLLQDFPSIDPDRLDVVGVGMDQPLASNATETGRAMNRRVVFRVDEPPAGDLRIPPHVSIVERMDYRAPELIDTPYSFRQILE